MINPLKGLNLVAVLFEVKNELIDQIQDVAYFKFA